MTAPSYGWTAAAGLVPAVIPGDPLLVADSWLVDRGAVRGLASHQRRFATSCTEAAGLSPSALTEFWAAACGVLPRTGRWFPRAELTGSADQARLWLRVRPAQSPTATVAVWVADEPDPRSQPRRKGPDLAELTALRGRAAAVGAQEALLRTPGGVVVEAANSSIIWWEGEALCLPAADLPALPGVTAGLISQRAAMLGVPVRLVRRRLPDLADTEVWLVNALHGIRPVTAWIGSRAEPGAARRAADWQRWLAGAAEPLA